jgi:hypothetical protein
VLPLMRFNRSRFRVGNVEAAVERRQGECVADGRVRHGSTLPGPAPDESDVRYVRSAAAQSEPSDWRYWPEAVAATKGSPERTRRETNTGIRCDNASLHAGRADLLTSMVAVVSCAAAEMPAIATWEPRS